MQTIQAKNLKLGAEYWIVSEQNSDSDDLPEFRLSKVTVLEVEKYRTHMFMKVTFKNEQGFQYTDRLFSTNKYFFENETDAKQYIKEQKIEYCKEQIEHYQEKMKELE